MTPESWSCILSNARSSTLAYHDALPLPVDIRPLKTARSMRLRLDERRGVLKLTCPARTSRRAALAWAAEQHLWVEQQLRRSLPAEPFEPGARIPIEGQDVLLEWSEAAPRSPRLAGSVLTCGGPRSAFARRIERFLRARATERLSKETAEISALAGVSPRSVSIGDAQTRWGSCSSSGRIRYSWRLILAPPEARRYVVAHEVAHLVHMNHGVEFRRLEGQLFGGDCTPARSLLRLVGPRLHRLGLGS
jgi:predicted metal-dependent hydrolase